ncbi:MAG TPA: hypothetical protein VKB40_13410 [Candidatus Acidoferrales bacterium]|nr:hypothetical protein [Candidatus Acidoferrales bacterium]
MSWLLETLCSIFGAILDLARQTKLGDKSQAKWFHYSLAIGYYLLPLLVISALNPWRITVIATGLFMVSLMAGAVTEPDDLRVQ